MKRITGVLMGLAVLCGFATSCSLEAVSEQETAPETKILNPEDALTSSSNILIFNAPGLGSEAVDSLSASVGAEKICPVFDLSTGNVAIKRQCGMQNWYEAHFAEGVSLQEKARCLAEYSAVKSVEFNKERKKANVGPARQYIPSVGTKAIASTSFNDPYFGDQWDLDNKGETRIAPTAKEGADVNVKQAWTLCAGNPKVIVAIIDEPVDVDHPDLKANVWTNPNASTPRGKYVNDLHGWNFVDDCAELKVTTDGNTGHGTHVAGTVAAVNNNGVGVSSIAGGTGNGDGVRIMSCQIFNGNDGGYSNQTAKAFEYAADNGACIAQCSYGCESGDYKSDKAYTSAGSNTLETTAIQYFVSVSNCSEALAGGLAIFAAGNESGSICAYPGALKYCIAVCALGCDGLPTYYTNYGPGCNISAPGGEYYTGGKTDDDMAAILSTMPTKKIRQMDDYGNLTSEYSATNYGYMQGTSMACPHVSSIAALGISYALKNGYKFTNDEFTSILLTSVDGLDDLLVGTKLTLDGNRIGSLRLPAFRGNLGSGSVNVWKMFMQMDGVPSIVVKTGQNCSISLSDYFGGDSENLEYTGVRVLDNGTEALGLASSPVVKSGKLVFTTGKSGCARLEISAIAGSSISASRPSGYAVSKVVSIISKPEVSSNGAWL